MKLFKVLTILAFIACGTVDRQEPEQRTERTSETDVQQLKNQLLALQGQISSLVSSDFKTCSGPSVSDPVVQRVCTIAQAANVETISELRNSLNTLVQTLDQKLKDTQIDVASLASMWQLSYGTPFPTQGPAPVPTLTDCQNNTVQASFLGCSQLEAGQIVAINAAISGLQGVVSGTSVEVFIGSENIAYGPVYEGLVRLSTGLRINAYVNGNAPALTTGSNPLTATSGSSNVVVLATNTLTSGNYVRITDCGSGRGFTNQNLFGVFTVSSVSGSQFTVNFGTNATTSGTFGGTTCIVQPYTGSGMTTVWTSPAAVPVVVQVANQGSKAYNWTLMKPASGTFSGQGLFCYDITNGNQTYSNISTAGLQTAINAAVALPVVLGNLTCK